MTILLIPLFNWGGEWSKIVGKFLFATNDSSIPAGTIGGESSHTLTINELPHISGGVAQHGAELGGFFYGSNGICSVNITNQNAYYSVAALGIGKINGSYSGGTFNINFGGNQPHNNMPPYLSVHIWKRIG